jgi:hypothetical protein
MTTRNREDKITSAGLDNYVVAMKLNKKTNAEIVDALAAHGVHINTSNITRWFQRHPERLEPAYYQRATVEAPSGEHDNDQFAINTVKVAINEMLALVTSPKEQSQHRIRAATEARLLAEALFDMIEEVGAFNGADFEVMAGGRAS